MSAPPVKRKLAAILAADAVGYSRLMAHDEEGTMRVLSAHRSVIDGIIDFHGGRIVGTAGDSVLAEFASPVEALRCAVEIQAALKTRNASLPEASRLLFRIGINLGDVMVKGDDLLGDGVNVAARLEGIAEPGGICISSSVYDQIAGKLDLGFVEMGEQSLKNIDRPIRVYSVQPGMAGVKRAPRKRGRFLYPAFGALGAVAAAAGWWTFLGPGAASSAAHSRPQAPPRAVVPMPAASRAELAQRAEEHRAAVARDAEERKLAAERSDAEHKSVEARIAAVKANAEVEIARAQADAELARARAEAEQLRRQAATELAAARNPAAVPAAPAKATPAVAAGAPALAAANPQVPAMLAKSSAAVEWIGKLHCDAMTQGRKYREEYEESVPVRLENGKFVLQRRPVGMGGHFRIEGAPAADGTLLLNGMVIASHGRRQGQEVPARLEGRLDAGRYVTTGYLGERSCSLEIAKR